MRLLLTGKKAKYAGSKLFLVTALLAVTACSGIGTQIAQKQIEADHKAEVQRLEAQPTPQFSDPYKAAVVWRFEADFERFGRNGDLVRSGVRKQTCPIDDPRHAFRLIRGEGYEEQRNRMEIADITQVVDLDSIRIRMISGRCEMLGTNGDVEFIANMRTVQRIGGGQSGFLILQDSLVRVRGAIKDGERVGRFRTIDILQQTRMDRGSSGKFDVHESDWDHLNRMNEAPTAIYSYETFGPAAQTESKLEFRRQPETRQYTTIIEEPQPDGTVRGASYNGPELRFEFSKKNGLLHGWYKIHSYEEPNYTVPDMTFCYQNGVKVKSTTCPMN